MRSGPIPGLRQRRKEWCSGVIVEAADILHHGRQDRGGDIDVDGVETDAAGQGDRADPVLSGEQGAPANGLRLHRENPYGRRQTSPVAASDTEQLQKDIGDYIASYCLEYIRLGSMSTLNLENESWPSRPMADRLMVLLKTRGPQTAADLGQAVGTTGENVRQQLMKLAGEGFVETEAVARGVGRPTQYWHLTGRGHARFPIPMRS